MNTLLSERVVYKGEIRRVITVYPADSSFAPGKVLLSGIALPVSRRSVCVYSKTKHIGLSKGKIKLRGKKI